MDQNDTPAHNGPQTAGLPASSTDRAGDDDLLGVIAQVQSQLDVLRSAHSQRDQMRSRLETWESALTDREGQLKAHADALAGEQSRLEEWKNRLEQENASLDAARARLQGDQQTFDQRRSELDSQQATVDAQAKDLAAREEKLKAAAAEIGDARAKIAEMSARLEEAEKAAVASAAELNEARRAAETAGARADEVAATLEKERAAFRRDQEALASQLQSTRDDLTRSSEAQSHLIAELEAREKVLVQMRAEAGQAESARKSLEEAKQALSAKDSALAERDSRLAELTKRLEHAKGKLSEFSKSLEEQAALVTHASSMAAEVREKNEQIRKLEEQVAAVRKGASATGSETAELRRKVEAFEQQLATLREELETAREALSLAQDDARRWRKQAESGQAQGSGEIPAEVGEVVRRRWDRLRLMKTLLREEGEKLSQAGEALRARYQECEDVLAQKEELEAHRREILAQKAELERVRAEMADMQRRQSIPPSRTAGVPISAIQRQSPGSKQRVMAAAAASVVVLAGLAGLSWTVSGEIAPATYAARAVLQADAEGAAPDVLAEWQRYHESLLTDANMIEATADRMNRRGILSLGTPGLLGDRLKNDMSAESPQPGTLVVELRGGGRKTERELEVLVTAIASQGNATRERRPDGLGTLLTQPPTLGEPLSDLRVVYAGGMFAGGSSIFGLIGLSLWRRTTRAKARFEKEHEAMSDEDASWSQAPQVLGRPRL